MSTPAHYLKFDGAAIWLTSLVIYNANDYSIWLFALLLLVPDVFMLGYLKGPKVGAHVYNAGHSLLAPLLLYAVGVTFSGVDVTPYALIWTTHIGLDRWLGYGLKHTDDFRHTHLGWISSKK